MSTGRSASAPRKPAAATPTTVNACPLTSTAAPTASDGAAKSRRAAASPRTATPESAGDRSSAATSNRPVPASTPRTSKKRVTICPVSYGLAADPHGHSRIGDAGDVPDRSGRSFKVEEIRIRHHPESIVDRRAGHLDQLACVLDRRRFQQQDVENREDGHVQPNTEGKRDDGNDGKAWAAEQHTGGVADVSKCEHRCGPRSGRRASRHIGRGNVTS